MVLDALRAKVEEYLRNREARGRGYLILIVGLALLLLIPTFILERSSRKEWTASQKRLTEFRALQSEYRSLQGQIDTFETRLASAKVSGINDALNGIFSSLGIGPKIRSIKGVGNREIGEGLIEEKAEVQIDKMNMNELVNTLFRIREGVAVLSIKGIAMKKSFENPELLDVTLTIALFVKR